MYVAGSAAAAAVAAFAFGILHLAACLLGHLASRVDGICRLLHFRWQASCCRCHSRCCWCCCCCLPLLKLHTSAFLPAAAFCLLAVFGFLNGFCQIVTGPGQFSKFPAQPSPARLSRAKLSLIQLQRQRHIRSPFKPLSHFRTSIKCVLFKCALQQVMKDCLLSRA